MMYAAPANRLWAQQLHEAKYLVKAGYGWIQVCSKHPGTSSSKRPLSGIFIVQVVAAVHVMTLTICRLEEVSAASPFGIQKGHNMLTF